MSSSLRAVPGNVGSDESRRATLHGAGMRHSALLTQRVVGFRNMIGVYFELVRSIYMYQVYIGLFGSLQYLPSFKHK